MIGTIWDPSPDIHSHVYASRLPEFELFCGFDVDGVRLKAGDEAGTDSTNPNGRRQNDVTSDRITDLAMFIELCSETVLWLRDPESVCISGPYVARTHIASALSERVHELTQQKHCPG